MNASIWPALINDSCGRYSTAVNLQARGTYQHFFTLHQNPVAPGPERFWVVFFFFSFLPLSFCRAKSLIVILWGISHAVCWLRPAAASIATGAFAVSSTGRVIWLKNKQQPSKERQTAQVLMSYQRGVMLSHELVPCFTVFAAQKRELKGPTFEIPCFHIPIFGASTCLEGDKN